MDGCVWTFDAWCCGAQSLSEQLQLCDHSGPTFGFTTQKFSMVGGYTEDLEKTQSCQNWGVDTCTGQYGKYERWIQNSQPTQLGNFYMRPFQLYCLKDFLTVFFFYIENNILIFCPNILPTFLGKSKFKVENLLCMRRNIKFQVRCQNETGLHFCIGGASLIKVPITWKWVPLAIATHMKMEPQVLSLVHLPHYS